MKYEIEFDADEIRIASEWHSGQYSMLYAVASMGKLALGTDRPSGCDSDSEWFESLKDSLRWEIEQCADTLRWEIEQYADIAMGNDYTEALGAFDTMLEKLGIEK